MPAIQMTRLRIQVARLLENFNQPENFTRALGELLDFYSDRAHRPGRMTVLQPIQKQYRVHPAVLKQITDDLAPVCRVEPDDAAALADRLWRDDHFEPRLLAAGILALLPEYEMDVISQRLLAWAKAGEDRILIDALLKKASAPLMQSNPKVFRKIISTWLKDSGIQQQSIGLRALTLYIQLISPDLFPDVFHLITPLPVKPTSYLLNDLEALFAALYERSPGETLFYLEQLAAKRQTPDLQRLLRGCVNIVSDTDRDAVRALIM
ncbi:MAG: DNA alkylation repair protein [Anaerolineaceae bacterium]